MTHDTTQAARRPDDTVSNLLSVDDAALKLGISPRQVNEFVRLGELGCVQITKKQRRFTSEQLQRFIEARTVVGGGLTRNVPAAYHPLPRKEGLKRDLLG